MVTIFREAMRLINSRIGIWEIFQWRLNAVNRRLAGSIQDTSPDKSAVIDAKSKYYHLVVSRINLKLKVWNGNYLPGSYEADKLKNRNLREIFQVTVEC